MRHPASVDQDTAGLAFFIQVRVHGCYHFHSPLAIDILCHFDLVANIKYALHRHWLHVPLLLKLPGVLTGPGKVTTVLWCYVHRLLTECFSSTE